MNSIFFSFLTLYKELFNIFEEHVARILADGAISRFRLITIVSLKG